MSTSVAGRHFLDIATLSKHDLRAILDEAKRRKGQRAGAPKAAPDADAPLAGHALAMIFEKPSTRTRVSFDIAMRQLGGAALTLNAADLQLGRGETLADTARVLSRMVDCVMLRTRRHATVTEFAATATAPVINGLSDASHPCQIVADILTIEERLGPIAGKTIAWLGDGNNVCASLAEAAELLGFSLRIASPPGYALQRAASASVQFVQDPDAAAAGADVVATDTWVSMGDEDRDARMAAFPSFAVTEARMAQAAAHAIFLHCLPAHRGEEVSADVIDGQRSAVWDEAENRIHAQKAILLWCLDKL